MNNKKIAAFAAALLMAANVAVSAKGTIPASFSVRSVAAGADSVYTKDTDGFVRRMYNVVLGREPDPTGLNNWTTKLNDHTATASDLIYGFFWSSEYRGKNKSNDEIVTDCYNAMLDRDPDATGRTTWTARLSIGMTSLAVCKGFVGSSEFKGLCAEYGIAPGNISSPYARDDNYERTYFVYRLYQNCLGRTPDTPGLENWCRNLRNGLTGTEAANGFIFSSEYSSKNTSNSDFVTMLYNTLLGRSPDPSGKSSWTAQLDSGRSRQFVTNGFLFSNEFKGQCSKAGVKLSKAPSSTEYRYGAAPARYNMAGLTYIDGMLIANKSYSLPSNFDPGFDPTCQAQFNKMKSAAAAEGLNLYIISGYRSYSYQRQLYSGYVSANGAAAADTFSARAGHSEHQTGLAIDVCRASGIFEGTPEAKWLAQHCHEYGFILRYPQGKQHITGYKYEPWHIRYVGTDLSYKIHDSGLTVEEYYGISSKY